MKLWETSMPSRRLRYRDISVLDRCVRPVDAGGHDFVSATILARTRTDTPGDAGGGCRRSRPPGPRRDGPGPTLRSFIASVGGLECHLGGRRPGGVEPQRPAGGVDCDLVLAQEAPHRNPARVVAADRCLIQPPLVPDEV